MGLDMYAFTLNKSDLLPESTDIEPKPKAGVKAGDLGYWRKHHDLHGWMERLYREKGGKAEQFNCVPMLLTPADIDRLEADVTYNRLPPTTGFFFGNNPPNNETIEQDLLFIEKARQAMAEGKVVGYDSWW